MASISVGRGRGQGLQVAPDAVGAAAPDERDHLVALGEHPRQRERGDADALLGRDRLEPGDHLEVALEVPVLGGDLAAPVVGAQVVRAPEPAREQPAREGAVRDEGDPGSRASGSMWASGSRCSGEYSLWTAAIGCVAWARRSVAGWARRARRAAPCPPRRGRPSPTDSLDGHLGVVPVQGVDVDVVDPEAREARVDRAAQVLGAPRLDLVDTTASSRRPAIARPTSPRWSRSRKTRPCR